ncbi:peptidyl-prolyl cis-trans isomerase [Sutcliffiella cohnii]
MENIIAIEGKVKFPITLDPGVWIFDDRRIDLNTYFDKNEAGDAKDLEAYTKNISKHWDREIMEGAIYPPTLKSEKKFEKEKVLTGTFGIKLSPFLKNAEPLDTAEEVVFVTEDKKVVLSFKDAHDAIFCFSKNGKPLQTDGPVHLYYGDGSNKEEPIVSVKKVILR